MGWERKRGKIEEWNRLLRGATDTSFSVEAGDASVFPAVRYCITLDSDTRLPRDAAKKLIGIAAHPLNQPHFDPRLGRVTEGYGILQPRVSVTMASAAGSLFARLYAGHTGVDPYTTAVSDTYQDLFAEGIFTGKGLYDVDAFVAALEGRVPENALLSHDLFEGLYARTALVTDIEVVDDYPASVLAHARRQHRWVRGDWQILWWLFPIVPTRSGLRRNRLPLISRWKILDNLRRSLMAPATVALLLLAWTVLPGSPWLWTAAVLAALAFNLYPLALKTLGGPPPQQPWRVFLRVAREDANTALAQTGLQLTFLASQAWERVHAIGLTLVRLAATQRRMLEWETAAASADRGHGRNGARAFVMEMIASPLIALVGLVLVWVARPAALAAAVPVLVLWAAAPLVAHALSQPVPERRLELGPEDRAFFERVARDTWRYFETFMGPEDHGLPADNFQETPEPRVAHRTSPTNIGMGLLATLAAHDLGFIATDVLAREDRRDPHDDGGPGAARGPPAQLVRHAEPGGAPAPLRLDGRQREPGGRAHDARRGIARGGPAGARPARFGLRGRHGLPLPLRPAAPDPLDRLSPGGRRGAGPPGRLLLRPAGLGGAARELHRHRARRAPRDALVPPGPAGHERPRHADAPVVERHRLRVPDAAARDEELPRDAPRPDLPHGRAPPGRVRRRARRAVGDLRVRLQPQRSPRQLPVQGLRRPRPRPEAGPRRRAGRGALRDGARRDGGAAARGAQPAAPVGRRARGGLRLLRGDRLHARGGRRARPPARRPARPAEPSCGPSWPTTRA